MLRAGHLGSWHPAWSGLASLVGSGWRVGRARLIRQVQAAPDEGERDEARGQADEQHGLARARARGRGRGRGRVGVRVRVRVTFEWWLPCAPDDSWANLA